jgi:uncharacterized protein YlxW (UPF0749 family)
MIYQIKQELKDLKQDFYLLQNEIHTLSSKVKSLEIEA